MIEDNTLERQIIGTVISFTDTQEAILPVIPPEAFTEEAHRRIWRTMLWMHGRGMKIDLLTVANEVQDVTPSEISELTDSVLSAAHYQDHLNLFMNEYMKRRLKVLTANVFGKCSVTNSDAFEMISEIHTELNAISAHVANANIKTMSEIGSDILTQLTQPQTPKNGFKTGFYTLDVITGGLQSSDMIILAARPGMGKTAMALDIAANSGAKTLVFSLEMSARQIGLRMLAKTGVSYAAARDGKKEVVEAAKIGLTKIAQMPVYVDDKAAQTMLQIKSKAARLQRMHGLELVIVDYLQLMAGERRYDRNQLIGQITQELKQMAKELNVPVLALSQLSREVEKRGDKRPQLSDLRDSGEIEQNADLVLSLFRPECYGMRQDEAGRILLGIGWLEILKHRNGKLANIPLLWHGEQMRYEFDQRLADEFSGEKTWSAEFVQGEKVGGDDLPY